MFETFEMCEPSPWELLIERRAAEAKAEIATMAESARRTIGQMTRVDNLRERIEREREQYKLSRLSPAGRRAELQRRVNRARIEVLAMMMQRPDTFIVIPPGHRPSGFEHRRFPHNLHMRLAA